MAQRHHTRTRSVNAWHEYVTSAYYAERDAQQQRCDEYANGYATEETTFYTEIETRVTFKAILLQAKGNGNNMDESHHQLELDELNSRLESAEAALTFDQYQGQSGNTAIYPGQGEFTGLLYCALGLGEAGEVQGKIKKVLRDNNGELPYHVAEAIAKELGDLLWYVARTADELHIPLETIAQDNLDKLADRQARGVLGGSGDDR